MNPRRSPLIAAAASLAFAVPAAARENVCHLSAGTGTFHAIRISAPALPAHFAHGDCLVEDGIGCTTDTCDRASGCVQTPDDTLCDDGIGCTTDACDPIAGCVHTLDDASCDDKNACTIDTCDERLGCQNTPLRDGTSCSDGNVCNGSETCQGRTCISAAPLNCDDGVDCTADTCDQRSGCVQTPDDTLCDDGNECSADVCDSGCVNTPTPGAACNLGTQLCDATGRCQGCNGPMCGSCGCCARGFCDGPDTCCQQEAPDLILCGVCG